MYCVNPDVFSLQQMQYSTCKLVVTKCVCVCVCDREREREREAVIPANNQLQAGRRCHHHPPVEIQRKPHSGLGSDF